MATQEVDQRTEARTRELLAQERLHSVSPETRSRLEGWVAAAAAAAV